jgi:beta-ribofuranosylaminobenzene 5'-phosphate synthase
MSEIITGSRLHFGLFHPGAAAGQRRFGGAGMMIGRPGFHLQLTPSASWSAEGPVAERALAFARCCLEGLRNDRGLTLPPHHLTILQAASEHAGLGTGTQLGMAVARLLSNAAGLPDLSALERAALVGRGRRSGLGVHGFERGGFLVDGGRHEQGAAAPLIARMDFPAEWRILLVFPPGSRSWHGSREQSVFDHLGECRHTDRICRLMLLGLLPALAEADYDTFGEALGELNALAGEAFAPAQGGCYAGPHVTAAVHLLRSLGVRGTGQSSWGPLVFGIVSDGERASFLARLVRENMSLGEEEVLTAAPLNRGAVLL